MKVPLSIFSTFVSATPPAKLDCVAQLRTGYDVRTDWYKQLREALVANHRDGGSQADLSDFMDTVSGKKAESYRSRVDAYCDWWGERNIKWVGGKAVPWPAGDIQVAVNPELVVSVDGVRHVIKLYFAGERPSAGRTDAVLRLLEVCYRDGSSPVGRPVVGVLDIPRARLITPEASLAYLDPFLRGEAASFAAILGT